MIPWCVQMNSEQRTGCAASCCAVFYLQDMLAGQKLQGVLTSDEVQEILHARG